MQNTSKKRDNLFENNKKNIPSLDLVDDSTPFGISEAFRTLYTNVLYLNIEGKCKKIAVTSAISGEGKTTISSNLALTIAMNAENKRVLLIDTDMRKPRISQIFSIEEAHGLSEYLAGIDEKPNFVETNDKKITILTSGSTNVNPTKLISSNRMNQLFEMCNDLFDYVIVDTPPINIVSDALLLHDKVNGYIISVKANRSNTAALDECINKLQSVNAEIFGISMTNINAKSNRKTGYGSDYSYGK